MSTSISTRFAVVAAVAGALLGCAMGGAQRARPTALGPARDLAPMANEGGYRDSQAAPPPDSRGELAQAGEQGAPSPSAPVEQKTEYLVVEGWLHLAVDDVPLVAEAVRGQVAAAHGRVVEDNVSGSGASWAGTLKVRLPPSQVEPFLAWIGKQGEVEERRLQATDVSKQFFDADIALKNLEVTRARLEELLGRPGVGMPEILAIEKELERVRSEEETIKGQMRWLQDEVSYATLQIYLHPKAGSVVFAPEAKFHPGARLSALFLVDPAGRDRWRVGGGAVIHIARFYTIDLDIYPRSQTDTGATDSRALLATMGGAAYSDFLGRGGRRFLNPYLGYRMGYAYLSGTHRFAIGAELGVELYKQKYVMLDASVRALALIGKATDVALQGGLELLVAF